MLGNLDLDLLEEVLEHGVAGLTGLLESSHSGEPLLDVGAKLLDGVEFRSLLGEFIVGVRQLSLLHFADGDPDVGLLALERTAHQGRGEGRRFAGREPSHRFVQPIEHLARPDGDLHVVSSGIC